MMRHRFYDRRRPILSLFYAPLARVDELEFFPKLIALLVGAVQVVYSDLFTWVFVVLLVSGASDWILGRAAARRQEEFSSDLSAWGLQSKIAGVMQVLIIRSLEWALAGGGIIDTGGFGAVVVTAALIYQDVDSIEGHRNVLGGRPVPVLSSVLLWMERVTTALIPEEPEDRRHGPDDRREEEEES